MWLRRKEERSGLVELYVGQASETATVGAAFKAKPLKLLVSKSWGFLTLLPSFREYLAFGEQFAQKRPAPIPSFWPHTAQMQGFGARCIPAEKCLDFEGGSGRGT